MNYDQTKACQVGSIRQIHRRLVAEGYQVSENALRVWVKTGKVHAIYSGNVAYIAYDTVISYLNGSATA